MAKPSVTKHLCYLTPRPQLANKMLFYQRDPKEDILELWLPRDFPGLQTYGLKFEKYPGDSSIEAWNTSDTFSRLTPDLPLFEFRGRTDDWLRLTTGTACRALEIEDRLKELMLEAEKSDEVKKIKDSPSLSTSKTDSPISSSSSSIFSDSIQMTDSHTTANSKGEESDNKNDWQRIEAITVLGNARKSLSAIIQLKDHDTPTEKEAQAAKQAAETITNEKLQHPLILKPEAILFTSPQTPSIAITQKGSIQRKKNETAFAPVLDERGL